MPDREIEIFKQQWALNTTVIAQKLRRSWSGNTQTADLKPACGGCGAAADVARVLRVWELVCERIHFVFHETHATGETADNRTAFIGLTQFEDGGGKGAARIATTIRRASSCAHQYVGKSQSCMV